MCTTYLFMVQEQAEFPDGEWKTVEELELPSEDMPLCGCWLFKIDFEGERWKKLEESHRQAGNIDKVPQTKADTQKLNDMFRDKIFELLNNLSYSQRLMVERWA